MRPPHKPARTVPHEGVLGETAVVHRVARLGLDRRVDDRHQADAVAAQLLGEHRQLREALPVHREHLVGVIVIDVQVDRVEGRPRS